MAMFIKFEKETAPMGIALIRSGDFLRCENSFLLVPFSFYHSTLCKFVRNTIFFETEMCCTRKELYV